MFDTTCLASTTLRTRSSPEETFVWEGRVTYTESRDAFLPRIDEAPYHRWNLQTGEEWITFHRDGDDYVLRFPDLADFRISAHGRQVHCDAASDVSETTLRQLLNQILPLVLNGQFATVLHAGAVEVDEGAVAFLGPTGRGKSTLTAAMTNQGFRFLTDDALQVSLSASGQPVAAPGQPHLRLWNASDSTTKARIPAGPGFPHCDQQRTLTAIYLLGDSGSAAPSFERIRPSAALLELIRNSFLLDPESPELLKVQHDNLSAMVITVPVFRMNYIRNYETLQQVCRQVVAHARSCTIKT
jgi:hypothetical protein